MKGLPVTLVTLALLLAISTQAAPAHAGEGDSADPRPAMAQPEGGYTFKEVHPYPSLAWTILQLLPSPEVAVGAAGGQTRAAMGLRWQLTPLVWSWGTNRRISSWRFFVVDPIARHSGSLELSGNLEYFFGDLERFVARPGVRAYFPLAQRGEYLSASLGTSTYSYDDKLRVAYEVGAYILFGLFGVQVTVAPNNDPLKVIGTLRIRYF